MDVIRAAKQNVRIIWPISAGLPQRGLSGPRPAYLCGPSPPRRTFRRSISGRRAILVEDEAQRPCTRVKSRPSFPSLRSYGWRACRHHAPTGSRLLTHASPTITPAPSSRRGGLGEGFRSIVGGNPHPSRPRARSPLGEVVAALSNPSHSGPSVPSKPRSAMKRARSDSIVVGVTRSGCDRRCSRSISQSSSSTPAAPWATWTGSRSPERQRHRRWAVGGVTLGWIMLCVNYGPARVRWRYSRSGNARGATRLRSRATIITT